MPPDNLLALIQADATALALAQAGDDTACAARCSALAPPVLQSAMVTERTIFWLYDNPMDAETVLQTIAAVAEVNPIVKRVLTWLQPYAGGVDMGDARVRALLVAPVEAGGIGLAPALAAPLLAAGEAPVVITAADVGAALIPLRTGA
jgi:hypothetical protein